MARVTAFLPDERIIALYFDRDETAISETDRKYGNYLLTVALNILHDEQDSEECRNDTYLRVWNSIPPTKPQVFLAYLAKIIRGLAVNRWKEQRRAKRIPPEAGLPFSELEWVLAERSDAEDELESQEIGRIISEYLHAVGKRKRYIFMSRYYALYPIAEIACALGVSESTVKKELTALKKGLREALEREGITL